MTRLSQPVDQGPASVIAPSGSSWFHNTAQVNTRAVVQAHGSPPMQLAASLQQYADDEGGPVTYLVIGASEGAISDELRDDGTMLIIRHPNALQALASCLLELLDHPKAAEILGTIEAPIPASYVGRSTKGRTGEH